MESKGGLVLRFKSSKVRFSFWRRFFKTVRKSRLAKL